ncbi:hypothetical protein GGTG_05077 [Gaeumannomyces tritici R3-111a-1]|uniref:Uncharacterized protein n=1 Tax=Gaeumannomyces tritici (strain R3-111a-1) TaxID=644352 RepID=J3NUW8_GAET3|nr:hypothetical protein GGTG_05077 [Gaeumannomyces tritici R3-111a-1]EJT75140.1 hypothetical protein GGTG_05077 [Gaeumannomyces tritici R3-111a-1]
MPDDPRDNELLQRLAALKKRTGRPDNDGPSPPGPPPDLPGLVLPATKPATSSRGSHNPAAANNDDRAARRQERRQQARQDFKAQLLREQQPRSGFSCGTMLNEKPRKLRPNQLNYETHEPYMIRWMRAGTGLTGSCQDHHEQRGRPGWMSLENAGTTATQGLDTASSCLPPGHHLGLRGLGQFRSGSVMLVLVVEVPSWGRAGRAGRRSRDCRLSSGRPRSAAVPASDGGQKQRQKGVLDRTGSVKTDTKTVHVTQTAVNYYHNKIKAMKLEILKGQAVLRRLEAQRNNYNSRVP